MSLYPALNENKDNFRLQQICDIKSRLEKEREKRASLYKKYNRGVNICDGIDMTLATASLGLGAAGIGLLSTIIAAPMVLGMEAGAIICGLSGVASKFIARRLQTKAKKHDEIRVLAESKLNTISSHISKALEDNNITDAEFNLILSEENKFRQELSKIRDKKKGVGVSAEEKKTLIKQATEEAVLLVKQKLAAADLK